MPATHVIVIALVLVASIRDLRTRRIPNVLTFGAALAAIVFHTATAGWTGLAFGAGGWALGLALFFPFFALRGMGAGDVKLLAAVGAWLGPADVLWVAALTAMAGGVLGLVVAVAHGYLMTAMRNIWTLLMHWRLTGLKPLPDVTLEHNRGPRLAYAVPIAAGTVMTLWLK